MKLKDLFSMRILRRRKPKDDDPLEDIVREEIEQVDGVEDEPEITSAMRSLENSGSGYDVSEAWQAFKKAVGMDQRSNK